MCPIDSNRITQDRASLKEEMGWKRQPRFRLSSSWERMVEHGERKKIIVSTDVIRSCFNYIKRLSLSKHLTGNNSLNSLKLVFHLNPKLNLYIQGNDIYNNSFIGYKIGGHRI